MGSHATNETLLLLKQLDENKDKENDFIFEENFELSLYIREELEKMLKKLESKQKFLITNLDINENFTHSRRTAIQLKAKEEIKMKIIRTRRAQFEAVVSDLLRKKPTLITKCEVLYGSKGLLSKVTNETCSEGSFENTCGRKAIPMLIVKSVIFRKEYSRQTYGREAFQVFVAFM